MILLYYIMLCYTLYIFALTLLQNRVRAKVFHVFPNLLKASSLEAIFYLF